MLVRHGELCLLEQRGDLVDLLLVQGVDVHVAVEVALQLLDQTVSK